MRVQQLPPDISNFGIAYLPESLLLEKQQKDLEEGIAITATTPTSRRQVAVSPPQIQFVGIHLKSLHRRVLVRRSLSGSPDVSSVLPCDLRVQQILWRNINSFTSSMKESKEEPLFSLPPPDYYRDVVKSQEDEDNSKVVGTKATVKREEEAVTTSERKRQHDYRREIDLAHHILQMELEEDDDDHHHFEYGGHNEAGGGNGRGGSGASGSGGDRKISKEEHKTPPTTPDPPLFLHERVPSTMRFNDALVCTSKDVQILKSGAIKKMRLTVICHSDLPYQNHHRRHQQTPSFGGNHYQSQQSQKYFGNETTPKEETVNFFSSKKPKAPTMTTKTYSLSTSSVQVTLEEESEENGERKPLPPPPPTSILARQNISFLQENENEKNYEKTLQQTDGGKGSSSLSFSFNHDSNQNTDLTTTPNSQKPKQNWRRLAEKIRLIFQTYDVHVSPSTLVNLKNCSLASYQSNFSPAIRFIFVEECEITLKNKRSESPGITQDAEHGVNIGKVSGKTEIIITNVHHISYYKRIFQMYQNTNNNIHLYGLEHAAKILTGMIKTSGGGTGGTKQEENPVLPVTYTATSSSSGGLLTEFSHGLLISGPSGCGKVVVVRETAKKLGLHLLSFNPSSGVGGGVEESPSRFCQQLTDIFNLALATASRYQTVLLFPRIHLLFQQQPSNSDSFSRSSNNKARVLHHVTQLFDSIPAGFPLTVVGTTDKPFLVPLQLRRAGRLEKEIIISPPKESERLAILQELSRNTPSFKNMDFNEFARQTPGYVAQDLIKVLRLALFKCQEEAEEKKRKACGGAGRSPDGVFVNEKHMQYAIRRVVPSILEGALGVVDIQRAISLDHIAGLHSVKLDLIKAIVWPLNHPEAFLRMNISPPKGILLYGPPGNCKTTLVRAVAATHQTNFLSVSAAELFSSGVGDSEKIVAHLFHRARMASPCILFIDELESIVGSRQNSEKKQTGTNESILSMLLTEMDGVGTTRIHQHSNDNDGKSSTSPQQPESLGPLVLVVAATNRPDLIDPALLRPGRFDKLIGVPPLDMTGRKELLEWCSKSIPFEKSVDFTEIAADTECFSGADLVNLCREAALFSLSDSLSASFVTEKHVKMARSVVSPSLNPGMVQTYHEYGSKLHQQQQ